MKNKEPWGQRLKRLRSTKGLRQGDFASAVGVSQGTVSNWETGRNVPDVETMIEVADELGVTLDELCVGASF